MCIAIYSPKGNDVPCEEYLRNSFIYNPDGAGFAYNTNHNNVKIEKGFMNFNDFYKAFKKAAKKNDFKNRGVLIHFRITTHGGTNKECCHPFPLVSDEGVMKKTKCICDYAVIHNGIISLTSSEAYSRQKMSDTMVFIEKYLAKIATNKKWFKNPANFELIYDMIDSKMAILNGQGEIHSTAGFTKDADGNYYSNSSYKEARVKKNSFYGYSSWNDGFYSYNSYAPAKSICDSETQFKDYYSDTTSTQIATVDKEDDTIDGFGSYVDWMEVQKLDVGQIAITESGELYGGDDDGIFIFRNAEGDIFLSDDGDLGEHNTVLSALFIGTGYFVDASSSREISFRGDYDIYVDGIQ